MYRVAVEFPFCYAHRLADHPGKCRNLHGHNGRAVVAVEAPDLNDAGMVIDFGELKHHLGGWIDRVLDHATLLDRADPLVAVLEQFGQQVIETDGPPTAERIARVIFAMARGFGFPVAEVVMWET